MPVASKGARLYLKPAYGTRQASWIIRDGSTRISTGCGAGDRGEAEKRFAEYLADKHDPASNRNVKREDIYVADVLNLYVGAKTDRIASPIEFLRRVDALLDFWGAKTLAEVNGVACRSYVAHRGFVASARRELEDLRAAINLHRREGLHNEIVSVTLPPKPRAREKWITRDEAARLIWAAWRYRERQNYRATQRRTRQHIARFIIVALYTGTRSGAICSASFERKPGRGYVDLDTGIFYRLPESATPTNKRQPTIKLPRRLVSHLRRWHKNGAKHVVEFEGRPVKSIKKSFARVAGDALPNMEGITPHVLRHSAITWAMRSGEDIWKVGGYVGATVQTIERNYAHHREDHSAAVGEALTRKRK